MTEERRKSHMEKKTYNEPKLATYGDVEEITLQGHMENADTPEGINNTAFSPK
jgi:hypothetical protein